MRNKAYSSKAIHEYIIKHNRLRMFGSFACGAGKQSIHSELGHDTLRSPPLRAL